MPSIGTSAWLLEENAKTNHQTLLVLETEKPPVNDLLLSNASSPTDMDGTIRSWTVLSGFMPTLPSTNWHSTAVEASVSHWVRHQLRTRAKAHDVWNLLGSGALLMRVLFYVSKKLTPSARVSATFHEPQFLQDFYISSVSAQ